MAKKKKSRKPNRLTSNSRQDAKSSLKAGSEVFEADQSHRISGSFSWQKIHSEYDTRLTFLVEAYHHLFDNLKLADQKAAGLIAINTAIAGIIVSSKPFEHPELDIMYASGVCLAIEFLMSGTILAFAVLWPRGEKIARTMPAGDITLPSKISFSNKTITDFIKLTSLENRIDLIEEISTAIYARAKTNDRKYSVLRIAMVISAIAWFVACFAFFRKIIAG